MKTKPPTVPSDDVPQKPVGQKRRQQYKGYGYQKALPDMVHLVMPDFMTHDELQLVNRHGLDDIII